MTPCEYRFVRVDQYGVWEAITYRLCADDKAAKRHAAEIADRCAYVLVWTGALRVGLVASLSNQIEFFPAA